MPANHFNRCRWTVRPSRRNPDGRPTRRLRPGGSRILGFVLSGALRRAPVGFVSHGVHDALYLPAGFVSSKLARTRRHLPAGRAARIGFARLGATRDGIDFVDFFGSASRIGQGVPGDVRIERARVPDAIRLGSQGPLLGPASSALAVHLVRESDEEPSKGKLVPPHSLTLGTEIKCRRVWSKCDLALGDLVVSLYIVLEPLDLFVHDRVELLPCRIGINRPRNAFQYREKRLKPRSASAGASSFHVSLASSLASAVSAWHVRKKRAISPRSTTLEGCIPKSRMALKQWVDCQA